MGTVAEAALGELGRAVSMDQDRDAQTGACQVIDVGPAIEELLMQTGWTTRWAAVRALGVVGKGNRDALPSLTVALLDEEWQVRGVAALAIGQSGIASSPGETSALADKLRDENAAVRKAAAIALGEIGVPAQSSIASLRLAAGDDNAAVRESAEVAIRKILAGQKGERK
jgi:HEAT repeat protein